MVETVPLNETNSEIPPYSDLTSPEGENRVHAAVKNTAYSIPSTTSGEDREGKSNGTLERVSIGPASSKTEIRICSPWETRILLLAFAMSLCLLAFYHKDVLGPLTQKLVFVLGAALIVGTVDYFQKVYVLGATTISRRVLFIWHRYALPDEFVIKRERSGGILILDDAGKSPIFAIGRDMASPQLISALRQLYNYSAGSHFEIT